MNILRRLLWPLRLIALISLPLLTVGLVMEWIPFWLFNFFWIMALLVPFLWPRHFGSWWGMLVLVIVAVGAGSAFRFVPDPMVGGVEARPAALCLFVLAVACLAAPASLFLLLWQRQASVAVILFTLAVFPVIFSFFIITGTFAQSLTLDATAVGNRHYMLWFPLVYFPLLGCCLGPLGFMGSFVWLLWREMRGNR